MAEGGLDRGVVEGGDGGIGFAGLLGATGAFPFDAASGPFRDEARPAGAEFGQLDHQPVGAGYDGAHREGRVEQDDERHLFACSAELAAHFPCGEAAAGEAAQQVGPVWLDLAEFGDAACRRLDKGVVRFVVAEEAARLQAVEGPVAAHEMGEVAQVEDVAEHARDEEEGRALPAIATMHGDEMGVFRTGRVGLGGGIGGLVFLGANLFGDEGRAAGDGRSLEQDRDREVQLPLAADHREEADGDQGMAAEGEEIVLDPHFADAEQFGPEADEDAFHLGPGGHIGGFQIGAGETCAFAFVAVVAGIGLTDQRGQVERGDDDLRLVGGKGAEEGLGPFGGADAFFQRLQEALLGG